MRGINYGEQAVMEQSGLTNQSLREPPKTPKLEGLADAIFERLNKIEHISGDIARSVGRLTYPRPESTACKEGPAPAMDCLEGKLCAILVELEKRSNEFERSAEQLREAI